MHFQNSALNSFASRLTRITAARRTEKVSAALRETSGCGRVNADRWNGRGNRIVDGVLAVADHTQDQVRSRI